MKIFLTVVLLLTMVGCSNFVAAPLPNPYPYKACLAKPDFSLIDSNQPLTPCLPTFNTPQKAYLWPIFVKTLKNVKAGELYLFYYDFEVTNNTGTNVQVTSQLYISPDGVLGQPGVAGQTISAYNGFNVSQAMHHGVLTKTVPWVADRAYSVLYVQVLSAAATDGAPEGSLLEIHTGNYERFTATLVRP